MKSNKRSPIDMSIAHWKRMIVWVTAQSSDFHPWLAVNNMWDELGEDWYAESCELCSLWRTDDCVSCPIVLAGNKPCDDGVWFEVHKARTRRQWLNGAKKMLKLLQEVKANQ